MFAITLICNPDILGSAIDAPCRAWPQYEISQWLSRPVSSTHALSGAKRAFDTSPCGKRTRICCQSVLHKHAKPQEIVTTWTPFGAKATHLTTPSLWNVHDADSRPRLHTLTMSRDRQTLRELHHKATSLNTHITADAGIFDGPDGSGDTCTHGEG